MGVEHGLLEATLPQKVPTLMVSRSCEGKGGETQLKAHYLQHCPEPPLLTPFRTVSWVSGSLLQAGGTVPVSFLG